MAPQPVYPAINKSPKAQAKREEVIPITVSQITTVQ